MFYIPLDAACTSRRRFLTRCLAGAALLVGTALSLSSPARADVSDRLFEFTDAFYRQNGVDPAKIAGRRQAGDGLAVRDAPLFSFQRDVRATFTIGGWDDGGKPVYYTVFGELSGNSFTANGAGQKAMQMADNSPEYIFPARGTDPLSLGSVRQPFMLDLRHGYFSNNPLGLWIHVFVSYTSQAFNTSAGRKALSDLADRNGLALDGTPIIRTVSELDNLYSQGYITKRTRASGVSGRYAVCPVIKDPTDGGIAPDQFLFTPRRSDGAAVSADIQKNFDSLQQTGRWAN